MFRSVPSTVLALPATALVLPSVNAGDDPEVMALRAAVAALPGLDGRDVVVAAPDPSAGPMATWLTPPEGEVHLGGLGLAILRAPVAGDGCGAAPGADLAVLAVWAAGRGATTVRLLALPAQPVEPPRLDGATLVVAGDLAPAHGAKPPRPDLDPQQARHAEDVLFAALGDPDALTRALPAAGEVGCRSAAALLLASRVAAARGAALATAVRTEVAGVGGIVAAWT